MRGADFLRKATGHSNLKGLRRFFGGYQQSYPQKFWNTSENLLKSTTCHGIRMFFSNFRVSGQGCAGGNGRLRPLDSAVFAQPPRPSEFPRRVPARSALCASHLVDAYGFLLSPRIRSASSRCPPNGACGRIQTVFPQSYPQDLCFVIPPSPLSP